VEKDEHDVKSNAKKDKPDIKSNDEVKSKEKVKDAAKSSKKRSRASLKSEEQMSPTKPARKKSSSRPALRAEEEPPADVTPPPRLEDNDDEPPAQVTPTPQARSEPANDEEPPAEVTPPPRQSFWQNRFMVISNIYNILFCCISTGIKVILHFLLLTVTFLMIHVRHCLTCLLINVTFVPFITGNAPAPPKPLPSSRPSDSGWSPGWNSACYPFCYEESGGDCKPSCYT
jgi:hypothetical protein